VEREVLYLRLPGPYHASEAHGEEGVLGLYLPWVRMPYALGAVKTERNRGKGGGGGWRHGLSGRTSATL
jgi:hypothetical protein